MTEAPASRAAKAAMTTTSASSSKRGGAAAGRTLHVEDEPLALAAGAADHDLVVRGLLLLAQHRVAVLGDSGNHPRHALAADAELAGIIDIDAGLVQHFQNLAALGDVIFLAGACELDPEAAGGGRLGFGGEILHV